MRLFEFFSGSLPNGAGTLELNPPHLLHPNSSLFLFDQLYRRECQDAKFIVYAPESSTLDKWTFKVMESDCRGRRDDNRPRTPGCGVGRDRVIDSILWCR